MTDDLEKLIKELTFEEKAKLLIGASAMESSGVDRLGIKGIAMADGPHGVRNGDNPDCVSLPCLSAVGASWNRETAFLMGETIGKECLENDKDMILGPAINMKRIDLCGRNFEYFSEDPVLSGELAAEYINGVQGLGVGTSLKHFAVNNQEVDRLFISAEIDERTMREVYLKAFEIAIKKAKPASVMCALNKVNSVLCSENKFLLTDILKEEWGFEGFVVSDWGCVKDSVKALRAGLDLQMPSKKDYDIVSVMKEAVDKGIIKEEEMDEAAIRILGFIMNRKPEKPEYDRKKQYKAALEIAEESIVLLKNKDNLLPISEKKYKKIAVIGEYANKPVISGYGSSQVYIDEKYIQSPLEHLKRLMPGTEFVYLPWYSTDEYLKKAPFYCMNGQKDIEEADLVLMFAGRQESVETEGTDRVTSHIDPYYEFFIKRIYPKNKNIVLVLQSGGAVIPLNWQDNVKGIIQMWYGGEAAGEAIANILCGKVNPSGKLSEIFPLKTRTDIDYPGDGYKVCYDEKWAIGYRYYDMHQDEIWFPFGHGLSYTEFLYENLLIKKIKDGIFVSCTVKNTGKLAGKEVVELYIADRRSSVSRPKKELKDFVKVHLEAGEEKTVCFEVPYEKLAFYNLSLKKWTVEPGIFDIMIAASSQDIRLSGEYLYDEECEWTLNYEAEQIVG